jgi:hypothetical protein
MEIAVTFSRIIDSAVAAGFPVALLALSAIGAIAGGGMLIGGMLEREQGFSAPGVMLAVAAVCAFYLAGKVGG